MARSKGGKPTSNMKNNIFKVAGCRSLKAKNKAKAVTADRLKSLTVKNKQKIEDIDKLLTTLNDEVRQQPKPECSKKPPSLTSRSVDFLEEVKRYNETEKNCEDALGKLVSMEM